MGEKPAILIIVQVDHLSGEAMGAAVGGLLEAGAKSVNILPSVTKKNRPGAVLMIDTTAEAEGSVGAYLARELKISGYQRVAASHVYQPVAYVQKTLEISTGGVVERFLFNVKVVGGPAEPLFQDVEHDFVETVQRQLLEKHGKRVALVDLRRKIEAAIGPGGTVAVTL